MSFDPEQGNHHPTDRSGMFAAIIVVLAVAAIFFLIFVEPSADEQITKIITEAPASN